MTSNGTERKNEQFACRLDDVDGIKEHPHIAKVTKSGVTEVTQGDVLRTIRTTCRIKQEGTQLGVIVSNPEGKLSSEEMRTTFEQEVTKHLHQVFTEKSLPSA